MKTLKVLTIKKGLIKLTAFITESLVHPNTQ